MSHTTAGPAPTLNGGTKYPDPITPEMLPDYAHHTDEEIATDIQETEREIADLEATEKAERTLATFHPHALERRLADFRAGARPLQIAERRAFVAFLQRLQAARAAGVAS